MTNFGWWQAEHNEHGLVMCMLCFGAFDIQDMHKDENGDVWDVCQECQRREDEVIARRNSEFGQEDPRTEVEGAVPG